MSTIQNNSDFLFIYDATLCNPNGDPDQENKPRMDPDTDTNLVTDVRIKRFIRDYIKDCNKREQENQKKNEINGKEEGDNKKVGNEIFVDMEGFTKVPMEDRVMKFIDQFLDSEGFKKMKDDIEPMKTWLAMRTQIVLETENKIESNSGYYKNLTRIYKASNNQIKEKEKKLKPLIEKELEKLNDALFVWFIQQRFIDIRMFGTAMAVSGFPRTFTGPVQLNWGYSLHKVDMVDSKTITSIMNEGNSTFGKDYRVYYSLIAFYGTINRCAAETTGLSEIDRDTFRDALWKSISNNGNKPTRSKLNQFPKLYLEIVYNNDYPNGSLGDLRKYIKVNDKKEHYRNIKDVEIDFSKLIKKIDENMGEGKMIKEVYCRHDTNSDIDQFESFQPYMKP